MLQVTILGCGSSTGVPVIACDCTICSSDSNYNKRTRSAIFINDEQTKILIDFGPDIKNQLLREKIRQIDATILTHDHADHVGGIDELRIISFIQNRPLEVFTDAETATIIENRYQYLFMENTQYNLPQRLVSKPVDFYSKVKIGSLDIQFFRQNHGPIDSLGLRIGDLVYSSDVVDFPEQSKQFLQNIKFWILDCLDYKSNAYHAGLDKILQWQEEFKPEKMFLTNMNHNIDYHEVIRQLPANIIPLYDGYKLNL